ncbi:MAG TPA: GNAT family protein [Gammaproteobacteria bacterium]|nr:GNAT family protein [Gammaproteobacteria bacterium]
MRVYLERPTLRREQDYLQAVRRSRPLHRGFVSTPSTSDEYRDYLRRSRRKNQRSFFVSLIGSGELAGVINVNEIVRYSLQSARLGFYAFAPHAGSGLMREGLRLVLGWCFRELKLHRLEANIQPSNRRSLILVRSLGFRKEGLSRRYLKIGGRWQDHERWAILAEDWRQLSRPGGAVGRIHATPFRA